MIATRYVFNYNAFCASVHLRRVCQTRRISSMDKIPVLYGDEASPPVRFVMMTASALNIKVDFHNINLFHGENKSEFYKKINPLQKVPALRVGEDVICDSHAIGLYLCRLSDKQALYPEKALKRALVDQMLFFNSSTLFPVDSAIFTEFFGGKYPVDDTKIEQWNSALDYLELRLSKHKWLAGDEMSLCDLSCGATVSSLQLVVPPTNRHLKVNDWQKRLHKNSCFKINLKGLERLRGFVERVKLLKQS